MATTFRNGPGRVLTSFFALLATAFAAAAFADGDDPRTILNRAKAEVVTIPRQAELLAGFAWPPDGPTDPALHAVAREELVNFGVHGIPAIRAALARVDPIYSGDVTAALIQAVRTVTYGTPQDYLPGLEEAIWFGSIEARRLAMLEVARQDYPPAILTIIDAVHENPQLTLTGIQALGRMGNVRAKYFLLNILRKGAPRYQRPAAVALSRLGDRGLSSLRQSAASERRHEREAAIMALLPFTSPDDLTLLHEYHTGNTEDDPVVLERIRERAAELEEYLEQRYEDGDDAQDGGR